MSTAAPEGRHRRAVLCRHQATRKSHAQVSGGSSRSKRVCWAWSRRLGACDIPGALKLSVPTPTVNPMHLTADEIDRFWSRVVKGPRETDCWLWARDGAAIGDDGYGRDRAIFASDATGRPSRFPGRAASSWPRERACEGR